MGARYLGLVKEPSQGPCGDGGPRSWGRLGAACLIRTNGRSRAYGKSRNFICLILKSLSRVCGLCVAIPRCALLLHARKGPPMANRISTTMMLTACAGALLAFTGCAADRHSHAPALAAEGELCGLRCPALDVPDGCSIEGAVTDGACADLSCGHVVCGSECAIRCVAPEPGFHYEGQITSGSCDEVTCGTQVADVGCAIRCAAPPENCEYVGAVGGSDCATLTCGTLVCHEPVAECAIRCMAPPAGYHYVGAVTSGPCDEVTCGTLAPDASETAGSECAIRCAAPPEGCHYEGQVTSGLCDAVTCGELVCESYCSVSCLPRVGCRPVPGTGLSYGPCDEVSCPDYVCAETAEAAASAE